MEIGRLIIFDSTTGKPLADLGEMSGAVTPREAIGGLDYIELDYGAYPELNIPGCKYHIDTVTKLPVIDELPAQKPTYEELEDQLLLMQEGLLV